MVHDRLLEQPNQALANAARMESLLSRNNSSRHTVRALSTFASLFFHFCLLVLPLPHTAFLLSLSPHLPFDTPPMSASGHQAIRWPATSSQLVMSTRPQQNSSGGAPFYLQSHRLLSSWTPTLAFGELGHEARVLPPHSFALFCCGRAYARCGYGQS